MEHQPVTNCDHMEANKAKNKENVPAKSVEYYYDRYVKQDFEKTTIDILLCKEKRIPL